MSDAAPVISIVRSAPRSVDAVGLAVGPSGAAPRQLGLNRAAMESLGFAGKVGETLVVPAKDGPVTIAVGVGDDASISQLRDAAAAFARAAGSARSLATNLADSTDVAAAQAVVEGVVLARYRFVGEKNDRSIEHPVESLALIVSAEADKPAARGADRGLVTARSAKLARDLANSPPSHLTARDLARRATALADEHGLSVEVFDTDALQVLGCGGILGVNAGSVEPPRMIKLTYSPRRPRAHLALVGKGVMYDSGGISLKPSNPMHALMKMDMSGAAAVLAAMTALRDLGCRNQVTAWLMCTDNMPSGSAMKLGDVLRIRNGTTVEIHNTDAEGRLILADGLSLAAEAEPDAIVDIATLTGAAMSALGQEMAAVIGSDDGLIEQVEASSASVDEPVWQLPLAKDRYRKLLDSVVADMKNVGGPYAGATTAAIFLSEFVGDVPWAHLDIAGPMNVDGDSGWKSKGATGFGARLLIDLALEFNPA
ncbi:leucyl aminopeptidase [Ilumatobacter sp.]|uniref:leucyl aminopeptidase n=1 Tax=Ilumatobacter sp. TaxID=1967498 RepID=UPI003AF5CDC7